MSTKFYVNIDILNALKSRHLKVFLVITNLLKFQKEIKISADNVLCDLRLDCLYEASEKQEIIKIIHDLMIYGLIYFPEKTQDKIDFFTISLRDDVMHVEKRKIKIGDNK